MGLAKFGIFAKLAKFSLSLRIFASLAKIFTSLANIPASFDPSLLLILSSTASNFLHFALVFSLIVGLVDG